MCPHSSSDLPGSSCPPLYNLTVVIHRSDYVVHHWVENGVPDWVPSPSLIEGTANSVPGRFGVLPVCQWRVFSQVVLSKRDFWLQEHVTVRCTEGISAVMFWVERSECGDEECGVCELKHPPSLVDV